MNSSALMANGRTVTWMADVSSLIKAIIELDDRNNTNLVYFTPQQRKEIVEWLESKQAEIERLKAEVEKAREEGFTAGQNNVFEALNEGW